jgi:acyl carrier protein
LDRLLKGFAPFLVSFSMMSSSDVSQQVLLVLDQALALNGRALQFLPSQALLGALPELDSFAAVAVISGLEERFGIAFDDELDADAFATVATLVARVVSLLPQR